MPNFLNLGDVIVNADHITQARWVEANPRRTSRPGAYVELDLVSVSGSEVQSSDCQTVFVPAHLSAGLWTWLQKQATDFFAESQEVPNAR